MTRLVRQLWPLLAAFCVFLTVSAVVQMNLETLQGMLDADSAVYGMAAYVLLAVISVTIPFASVLPFIPVAVSLWGWQTTAALTLLAWTIGGQIVFEIARRYGKPLALRMVPRKRLEEIEHLVDGRSLAKALALRVLVHGDVVSYAFGIFTKISRLEFLAVTAIGVAPAAILYAYFGSMPLAWQITIATLAIIAFAISVNFKLSFPRGLPQWRMDQAHA